MNSEDIASILLSVGISPTANRITIMRGLLGAQSPVSLGELEVKLETIDRSNIFRTLSLLRNRHLVHVIEDGSESVKYELCSRFGNCSIDDMHVHFYCESCGETTCMEDIHIPLVKLPDEYDVLSVNYVVKGVCPKCRNRG